MVCDCTEILSGLTGNEGSFIHVDSHISPEEYDFSTNLNEKSVLVTSLTRKRCGWLDLDNYSCSDCLKSFLWQLSLHVSMLQPSVFEHKSSIIMMKSVHEKCNLLDDISLVKSRKFPKSFWGEHIISCLVHWGLFSF